MARAPGRDCMTSPDSTSSPGRALFDPASLRNAIDGAMLRDRGPLLARLRRLEGEARAGRDVSAAQAALAADLERSLAQVQARRARLPRVSFPEELPVSARRDEIAAAIRDH